MMNKVVLAFLGLILTLILGAYGYTAKVSNDAQAMVDKAEDRVTDRLKIIEEDIKEILRRVR